MPIDWFTVIAQVINFLVLVWLLKRFLYKPILHAIDEWEKGIATQLAQAEAKKAEAQQERNDFQHKNEAFDKERAAILSKATNEAQAERQRLLDEARKDADSLRAKRQEDLRNEQRNLGQEIIRWTQQEVFAIARKTLGDLAATSLEERMGEVFVQRLRALSGAATEQLAAASTHAATAVAAETAAMKEWQSVAPVITGSFRGEKDDSVYVWIRRFESEAEREKLYKAVYESDYWKNTVSPKVGELIDRSAINVQRIVPTKLSVAQ